MRYNALINKNYDILIVKLTIRLLKMAKLVKPSQFAKDAGISRQAVYAKLKRGTLKSKEVDNQLFIVVENGKLKSTQIKEKDQNGIDNDINIENLKPSATQDVKKSKTDNNFSEFQTLIESKNETIETLKGRIRDLKESNQQLTSVFRGEIDLLKEAFVEMKRIYVGKLELEQNREVFLENSYAENIFDEDISWIGVKKFLKIYGYDASYKSKVKDYLDFLYSAGDTRVANIDGKIKINEKFCSKQIIKDALSD